MLQGWLNNPTNIRYKKALESSERFKEALDSCANFSARIAKMGVHELNKRKEEASACRSKADAEFALLLDEMERLENEHAAMKTTLDGKLAANRASRHEALHEEYCFTKAAERKPREAEVVEAGAQAGLAAGGGGAPGHGQPRQQQQQANSASSLWNTVDAGKV